MPLNVIAGYRLDAVHAFRVRTLAQLGYATRVVLGNCSDAKPALSTSFRVDVSLVAAGRPPRLVARDIAEVRPGERRMLECAPFVGAEEGDVELVFHLVPKRLEEGAKDGLVDVSSEELFYYLTAQDHYAEYHREDGFSAGILYQSGAFNYELFSRDRSTLIQAPKIYVSEDVDTLLSLAHGSADPDYRGTAELRCVLVAQDGRHVTWVERLPAFTLALPSMRERARPLLGRLDDRPRFFSLYAVCESATLLPITIQRNDRTGAIGLEHSLPPLYYGSAVRGAERARAISGLAKSPIFRDGLA